MRRGFPAILDEPLQALAETDQFHAVLADGGLSETTDGRVQAWAVTTCRQDANLHLRLGHCCSPSSEAVARLTRETRPGWVAPKRFHE